MRKKLKRKNRAADILMPKQHRGKAQLSFQKFIRQVLKPSQRRSTPQIYEAALARANPSTTPASEVITRTEPTIATARGPGPWL